MILPESLAAIFFVDLKDFLLIKTLQYPPQRMISLLKGRLWMGKLADDLTLKTITSKAQCRPDLIALATSAIASSLLKSSLKPASNTAMAARLPEPIVQNGKLSVEP